MSRPEVLLAIVGLSLLLSYAQASRRAFQGRLNAILTILLVPAFIAALWQISRLFGWWTIPVFVGASLLVGTINAIAMRRDRTLLGWASPYMGTAAVACIAVSWLL